jgi:hypothetical protein
MCELLDAVLLGGRALGIAAAGATAVACADAGAETGLALARDDACSDFSFTGGVRSCLRHFLREGDLGSLRGGAVARSTALDLDLLAACWALALGGDGLSL